MRNTRITVIIVAFATVVILLYTSTRTTRSDATHTEDRLSPRPRSFFSLQTPLSLFPPNAIISLTEDNTTSFLARPAAFGPVLPNRGLSGQLWIGSGFGDDVPRMGTVVAGAEGELGCSDVPGWNNEHATPHLIKHGDKSAVMQLHHGGKGKRAMEKMGADLIMDSTMDSASPAKHVDDGTDDYLHETALSDAAAATHKKGSTTFASKHADIQSIQEGAEIAGKVVLLSRGGCGFLEKVNWVQRRGGVALIVGDDTRGGPLIQMYARGDTSNVTIPSIFTSYTTAHLLSSLIPSESYMEDAIDDSGNVAVKVRRSRRNGIVKAVPKKPKTPTKSSTRSSKTAKGWFSWFSWFCKASSRRGNEWIMVTEYDKEEDNVKGNPKANAKASTIRSQIHPDPVVGDDFVIGVQDWRDPDLVGTQDDSDKADSINALIKQKLSIPKDSQIQGSESAAGAPGLLTRIFGTDEDESDTATEDDDDEVAANQVIANDHGGLWVTLTPTSAATPFLDTFLVLVVSPLVTLSIVYAMLLLRSTIRRRRWRAPKSVVEQLPVRTYHTIPASSPQTRLPTPNSSDPNTPLLQPTTRSRPRSRTTSGLLEPGELSRSGNEPFQPNKHAKNEHEKSVVASEWQKHMNKQVECVVCLEEYVDGVSRVMSLPCGHEFHVECITPWLTTRRRTCPICKGDVVRSLATASTPTPRLSRSSTPAARSRTPSPRSGAYHDDNDNNDSDIRSLTGSIGVGRYQQAPSNPQQEMFNNDEDLERASVDPSSRTPRNRRAGGGGWRGLFRSSSNRERNSRTSAEGEDDRTR